MSQQVINLGVGPNTATGDPIRTAFQKINANFTDIYALGFAIFTPTTAGLVPASGGGTVNFLRADGTWQPVPGTVSSVSTSDAALTISPTTGAVVVSNNDFTSVAHGTVPASGGGTTNFLRADSSWQPIAAGAASRVTIFDQTGGASQTWTPQATTRWVRVICIGGGGGGASGANETGASTAGGGSGGSAGGVSVQDFTISFLTPNQTITFSNAATGGNGGAARASGLGTGTNGVPGSNVTFGVLLRAYGGANGQGGSTAGGTSPGQTGLGLTAAGTAGGGGASGTVAGSNGSLLNNTGISFGPALWAPTGGGGGGGCNASGVTAGTGGTGGVNGPTGATGALTGGSAGAVNGGAAGAGTAYAWGLATGGGGGGGQIAGSGNGGAGGQGADYGAGGGGGGGVTGTTGTSGAGGRGGYAGCIIIEW